MIDVKGLKKNYGGLQVLKGVDLTIDKGDCVVLVGPSGCGKSTFLRCLNRLEEPDGGKVIFNGKAVTDHDIDHVRQKMGMVFQHFNLFPHLTVKKNITLAPVKLGLMKQAEADAKAMRAAGAHRPGRQGRHLPEHAFRRAEAAHCHCACAGYEPRRAAVRRADLGP